MPFINIQTIGPSLSAPQKTQLFAESTRLMAQVMGKDPSLTAVRFDQQDPENWAISGKTLSGQQLTTAQITAYVTAGTNTAAQKERFLAAATAMMKSILGPTLAAASYTIIQEVPADSWGYDGQSQAARARSTP